MAVIYAELNPTAATLGAVAPTVVSNTGANFNVDALSFPSGTGGAVCYINVSTPAYASGGTLTATLQFYGSATSGNVSWACAVAPTFPGDTTSVEALAFNTAATATVAINTTSKGDTLATLSITSVTNVTNGGEVWLKIQCTNNATGAAVFLTRAGLAWNDGISPGGSGDFSGPASSVSGDLVTFSGTTGKLGADSGILASNVVQGPASSVANTVALYGDATGKLLTTSGYSATTLVRNGSATTTTAIAKWGGTGGNFIIDTGVLIDASNNVTGMGTLNTRTIANWVDGPASAPTSNLAEFAGTTGKAIQDSGVGTSKVVRTLGGSNTLGNLASYDVTSTTARIADSGVAAASVVVGPASAVSGNIATYNGTTGKLVQDSGVSATAHAARHLPGGADSAFTGGTFSAGDVAQWNGSAFVPRFVARKGITATQTITTTLTDCTGCSLAVPRAGTFELRVTLAYTVSASAAASSVNFAFSFSGTTPTAYYMEGYTYTSSAGGVFNIISTVGATTALATATLPATPSLDVFRGFIILPSSGTLQLRVIRAGSASTIATALGTFFAMEEIS